MVTTDPTSLATATDAWMPVIEAINDRLASQCAITMRWDVITTGGGCTALAGAHDGRDLDVFVTLTEDAVIPDKPDRDATYTVAVYLRSTSHLLDQVEFQVLGTLPLAVQTMVDIATKETNT